ncbi:MAG: ABC transporter permease [Synergistota bacterium]|nr:ABC transporter permease [Synergistota bacterium]
MNRLMALVRKEFIQMGRDRLTLAMMVMIPVAQLIIFGFAINTDVKHLKTVLFDQSMSRQSRELVEAFTATEYFDVTENLSSFVGVTNRIQAGSAKVGVIIPPDFASLVERGGPAQVQVIVDASDSLSAASAISAAEMLGMVKSRELLAQKTGLKYSPVYDIRVRAWYNRDFRSPWYQVPGILGVILTMTMMMVTSMAIVRERERGTLEQLLVTPMRPWELMVGKILPYLAVGYMQMTLGLLIGEFVFSVPFRGSMPLLYLLTFLFIAATLAWGVLISTVAKNQMQAMTMSIFGLLPSILLSGFMFPREAMPRLFYWISSVLPLTWFLQIIRAIMLKGVGMAFLWPQVGMLSALILLFLGVSLLKFRKTVD